jgi:hypothetical protein
MSEMTDVGGMFNLVTPEERQRWEMEHQRRQSEVGSFRKGLQSGIGSMLEFGKEVRQEKLRAEQRVREQSEFDETHDKKVNDYVDPTTGEKITSVNYARNDREPDLEAY